MTIFKGKLAIQQRVLPNYRVPFFDLLAQRCEGGLHLFAGTPRANEGITPGKPQVAKQYQAGNQHFFRGAFYLCRQNGFISFLEETDPHALIVEANPRWISTPAAITWMKQRGRKVVGWGLGSPPPSGPLAGLRERSISKFLGRFDALIAYSNRGADEFAKRGFPREKIFIAHNAVSAAPNQMPPIKPSAFNFQPSVLFVGRLQPRKQVDALIRACAQIDSNIRLVIVGDGPERGALEALARKTYPQTEFAGAKHGADLKPYFEAADLFVLPGTGGLAVQEAMSYGLPVIVARGDGTQDDLVREGNGWQIEPENYYALLNALKTALSDTARLRKMGAESFRIVSEEINIEKMADVFIEALNA